MKLIKVLTALLVKATESHEAKLAKQTARLAAYITRLESNQVKTTAEMEQVQHFAASFDSALAKLD